jgi:hypothetical protein
MSASTMHVAGREWFGAVFHEPLTTSTRRSFSKTTQRQLSDDPIGPSRIRFLRRIDNKGHAVGPADCGPTGEGKTDAVDPYRQR